MTRFYYENDADLAAIAGQTLAVVGYGNRGRTWTLPMEADLVSKLGPGAKAPHCASV